LEAKRHALLIVSLWADLHVFDQKQYEHQYCRSIGTGEGVPDTFHCIGLPFQTVSPSLALVVMRAGFRFADIFPRLRAKRTLIQLLRTALFLVCETFGVVRQAIDLNAF
jgi:hypothetical protein